MSSEHSATRSLPSSNLRWNCDRRNSQAAALLVFLLALAARALPVPWFDFAFDDAYITFRIARNLARGLGFVYNPGQPVLTTTTPLYAILMIPGEVLGLGGPLWSRMVNAVAAAFVCLAFNRILERRVSAWLRLLLVSYVILNPFTIAMALCGMESAVTASLLLLATLLYRQERGLALGCVLGLCAFVRPEGALAAGIFWFHALLYKRRLLGRITLPLFVAAAGWFLYADSTFGSVIPNSVTAKEAYAAISPTPVAQHLRFYWSYLLWSVPLAPILILAIPFGVWRIASRDRSLLPICCFVVLTAAGQILSRFPLAYWYLDMIVPPLLVVMAMGIEQMLGLIPGGWHSASTRRWPLPALALILTMNCLGAFFLGSLPVLRDFRRLDRQMGEIADWFEVNDIPGNRVTGLEAIGRLGYDTDLEILDFAGLASPEVIPFIRANNASIPTLLTEFRPSYFVATTVPPGQEPQGYEIVSLIPLEKLELRHAPGFASILARTDMDPLLNGASAVPPNGI